jgi:hypothetical protein
VPLQGAVNPCLHASLLLAHYASYDSTGYDNRIPNGPHGCRGVYQRLEVEGKTRQSGQRRPEQTERGTKRHKGWPSTSTFRDLVEGTSSFVSEFRPGGFVHGPSCGQASSRPDFPDKGYPGTLLETTWPGFDLGEGAIYSCLVLWRGTCPCCLSPTHGDRGSTLIPTWHCGAQFQTISQHMSSRTASTRQVPVV